jgi:hypothetical protein
MQAASLVWQLCKAHPHNLYFKHVFTSGNAAVNIFKVKNVSASSLKLLVYEALATRV